MFEEDSRYSNLETVTIQTPDKGVVSYKKRRFLPQAEQREILAEFTVTEGERLDLIAARIYGDSEQFWQICDANNAMNPFELTKKIGNQLKVTSPEVTINSVMDPSEIGA